MSSSSGQDRFCRWQTSLQDLSTGVGKEGMWRQIRATLRPRLCRVMIPCPCLQLQHLIPPDAVELCFSRGACILEILPVSQLL